MQNIEFQVIKLLVYIENFFMQLELSHVLFNAVHKKRIVMLPSYSNKNAFM